MSTIRLPKRPPMAISARKAITVVIDAANTGCAMRVAARSAASAGPSPSSRARQSACSPTTMASSTTSPRVMISANSDIMLKVSPIAYIAAIAASIATGIPAATQKAVRAFRNKNSSMTTSASPSAPLLSRMLRRPVITSARVLISSICTPSGKVSARSSATRCAVCWMPIASPWAERSTRTVTAESGPTNSARSRSACPTRTSATSPMVRLAPSGPLRRTMAAISSAVRRGLPVRTRAAPPPTSPAGSARVSAAIAAAMSAMATSWRTSDADETRTTVSGAAIPLIEVRVTPSANSRIAYSSANRPSWSTETGPVITTSVTRSDQPERRITGSSVPSGRRPVASIAACTSSAARFMSWLGSKSSEIVARPSRDCAVEPSTPSTARSAGSSNSTMPRSTSSAPAPCQSTETEML
jgi:hypothetical protein